MLAGRRATSAPIKIRTSVDRMGNNQATKDWNAEIVFYRVSGLRKGAAFLSSSMICKMIICVGSTSVLVW
jgi:hypothetical protein